jgi:transcriptional regulator with XRE-family HTH domain
MSELNYIADEAVNLLDSIRIDFEKLQERKRELYPLLPDAQFARLLGITPATYSDYKNKKAATPSLRVGLKAALVLRFDLRELVPQAGEIETFFARNLR